MASVLRYAADSATESVPRARSAALTELERLQDSYGPGIAKRKIQLLRLLNRKQLNSARDVVRLHELLCLFRAYPDNPALLRHIEQMLKNFHCRSDLKKFRELLADSGIAGTPIEFSFYWEMARWLASRWPDQLRINWDQMENGRQLEDMLHLLVPYAETLALDEYRLPASEWMQRLKGTDTTDATFLIRRFASIPATEFIRQQLYETLDVPMRIETGAAGPSRTNAYCPGVDVHFQTAPRSHFRPDLRKVIDRPPLSVRRLSPRQAEPVIDIAREAMVTRARDLDAISWASPRDVRLVQWENGLQFAWIGVRPDRRFLLECIYVFMTLKNGVPIGYVQATALFGSAEINYNVFPPWRGAEAAIIYSRALGTVRHLLGCDTFVVDPYQMGHNNPEALNSGAWWFYYKLGYRPHDKNVQQLLRKELKRLRMRPGSKTSKAMLARLAESEMYIHLDRRRSDVIGKVSTGNVGLKISRYLADRFGHAREAGIDTCRKEAMRRLGINRRTLDRFSPTEKQAWKNWSPLVMILPDLERWTRSERIALVKIIQAKGSRHESDFVVQFDNHPKLRRAILKLAGD